MMLHQDRHLADPEGLHLCIASITTDGEMSSRESSEQREASSVKAMQRVVAWKIRGQQNRGLDDHEPRSMGWQAVKQDA